MDRIRGTLTVISYSAGLRLNAVQSFLISRAAGTLNGRDPVPRRSKHHISELLYVVLNRC